MRSNCYVWAWQQEWRRGWRVRYVRSKFGWWGHVHASPDGKRWFHFVPLAPQRRRLFPPLWYRGRVRRVT